MPGTTQAHVKVMEQVMNYCLSTRERGLELRPEGEWTGNPEFKLKILGRSDSDYTKDVEKRKSISGTSTFLCGAPIIQCNTTQKIVALLVTEAELITAMTMSQDMKYVKRRIDQFESRIANDFGGGKQMGS